MKKILVSLALLVSFVSFGQSSEKYFLSAYEKAELMNYKEAIADYTKAIEINDWFDNPNSIFQPVAYEGRASAKLELKDYKGAILDYNNAIILSPSWSDAYYNRAVSKYYLDDMNGACKDARKAQELGFDASALVNSACN